MKTGYIQLEILFNVELFPLETTNISHPKIAYTSKAECLKRYESKQDSYVKLRGIVADILRLHDHIQISAAKYYSGRAGQNPAYIQARSRGQYEFIFLQDQAGLKMADGALIPILGAFRYLVKERNGELCWRLDSFEDVIKFFDKIKERLFDYTKSTSDSRGRNPNAIGKDDTHWNNLYQTVQVEYLVHWNQKEA